MRKSLVNLTVFKGRLISNYIVLRKVFFLNALKKDNLLIRQTCDSVVRCMKDAQRSTVL